MAIFISYRRGQTNAAVRLIFKALAAHFEPERIFYDVDSVPLGTNFVQFLQERVAQCDVMLVVIGRDWLSAGDIDNPDDWVRIEVEAALGRNIPVIPLVVDGGRIPSPNKLPTGMKELPRRQALVIDCGSRGFDQQMEVLIRELSKLVKSTIEVVFDPRTGPLEVSRVNEAEELFFDPATGNLEVSRVNDTEELFFDPATGNLEVRRKFEVPGKKD